MAGKRVELILNMHPEIHEIYPAPPLLVLKLGVCQNATHRLIFQFKNVFWAHLPQRLREHLRAAGEKSRWAERSPDG